MGFIFCIILALVYYGSAFAALAAVGAHREINKISLNEWVKILGILFGGMIFVGLTARTQQTIYCFDTLQIWEPAVACHDSVFSGANLVDTIREFVFSVNHYEKNNFLPLIMAIPLGLNIEFPGFLVCGWIVFAAPSLFVLSLFLKWYLGTLGYKNFSLPFIMLIAALIPSFSVAMFGGYMNVSIMLTGSAIFFLCLEMPLENLAYKKLCLLSVLSVMVVIETRTAAYMVVSCFVGQFFLAIYRGCAEHKIGRFLSVLLRGYAFIGITAGLFLLAVFPDFLIHSVFYDIKTAYSAYSAGYAVNLTVATAQIGVITLLLVFAGILLGIKNEKLRSCAILSTTCFLSGILLFCRVQMTGFQHIYIAIVPLTVVIVSFVTVLYCDDRLSRRVCGIFAVVLLSFNFAQCYFNLVNANISFLPLNCLIATNPENKRYDINEISMATKAMREISHDNSEKIYIIASSEKVSPDLFNKVYFPRQREALNLAQISHVDLRDGFPLDFLTVDVVAVADPIQTHLGEKNQSVIKLLGDSVLNESPISKHFRLVREVKLHPDRIWADYDESVAQGRLPGEVSVKIYRKTSSFSVEDIDYLISLFNRYYADYPDLFETRLEQYKESIAEGRRERGER